MIYTNPLKPSLSPAYDFVPTIGYISQETLGLNLGGTKEFNDVTIDKFKKMAKQAGASERLTANIVNETCERVLDCWKSDRYAIGLPAETLTMLDQHMKTLTLLKPHWAKTRPTLEPLPWLKDLIISDIEFDPIVPERTMILEAATGSTTPVHAPERMEENLINFAARRGVHPDLGKGTVRAFVGEHLYRQWRLSRFAEARKCLQSSISNCDFVLRKRRNFERARDSRKRTLAILKSVKRITSLNCPH